MSNNSYTKIKVKLDKTTEDLLQMRLQQEELIKTINKLNNYIDMMEDKLVQKDKLITMISHSTLHSQTLKIIENDTVKKWLEIKQKTIDKMNKK